MKNIHSALPTTLMCERGTSKDFYISDKFIEFDFFHCYVVIKCIFEKSVRIYYIPCFVAANDNENSASCHCFEYAKFPRMFEVMRVNRLNSGHFVNRYRVPIALVSHAVGCQLGHFQPTIAFIHLNQWHTLTDCDNYCLIVFLHHKMVNIKHSLTKYPEKSIS